MTSESGDNSSSVMFVLAGDLRVFFLTRQPFTFDSDDFGPGNFETKALVIYLDLIQDSRTVLFRENK